MSEVTEAEIEAVLATFPPTERAAIEDMRKELAAKGIVRQPLQIEMACLFAEVLLASRKKRSR